MAEQDLVGAVQTLIARAGGRAGNCRAEDRAGPLRHCRPWRSVRASGTHAIRLASRPTAWRRPRRCAQYSWPTGTASAPFRRSLPPSEAPPGSVLALQRGGCAGECRPVHRAGPLRPQTEAQCSRQRPRRRAPCRRPNRTSSALHRGGRAGERRASRGSPRSAPRRWPSRASSAPDALGRGQDELGLARGLRLAVRSSGSEGP